MALTISSTGERYGDRFVKGLRLSHLTLVIGATGDYSTAGGAEGLDMESVKPLLGLGSVVDVLRSAWFQSTGAVRPYVSIFMAPTNRLRAFKGSAGALVEIVPGTDLAAGDLVQMTLIGG